MIRDSNDCYFAKQYLLRSVSRVSYWQSVSPNRKNDVVTSLHSLNETPSDLNIWIAKWLTPGQQKKLTSALNNARMRSKGKTITISDEAHAILKSLADADDTTLSQVIVSRLKRAKDRLNV